MFMYIVARIAVPPTHLRGHVAVWRPLFINDTVYGLRLLLGHFRFCKEFVRIFVTFHGSITVHRDGAIKGFSTALSNRGRSYRLY